MTSSAPWPREEWLDRVLDSDLSALAKITATVYARHAASGDTAWVTVDRLAALASIGRRSAIAKVDELIASGWLVLVERARQHRSNRYRLTIPSGAADAPLSPSSSAADAPLDTASGAADAPLSPPRGASHASRGASHASRGAAGAPDRTQERTQEGSGRATTRPSSACPQHPTGTDQPCRACGEAREAAKAWTPPPPPAASTVLASERCPHGDLDDLTTSGEPRCPLCRRQRSTGQHHGERGSPTARQSPLMGVA